MAIFEELYEQAKAAAFATVEPPPRTGGYDPTFSIVGNAMDAIAELLPDPEEVEPSWLSALLLEKPELFEMYSEEAGTLAESVVRALRNFMIDEMEVELTDLARDAGYDIPSPPGP